MKHLVKMKVNIQFEPLITGKKVIEPLSSGIVKVSFALNVIFAVVVI